MTTTTDVDWDCALCEPSRSGCPHLHRPLGEPLPDGCALGRHKRRTGHASTHETERRSELPVPEVRRTDARPQDYAIRRQRASGARVRAPSLSPALSDERDRLPRGVRDWLKREGAEELATHLSAYWERRGGQVVAWVEKSTLSEHPSSTEAAWCVRSDMISGLPRRRRGATRTTASAP